MSNPDLHPNIHAFKTFKRCDRLPSEQRHLWMIRTGIVRTVTWTDEGDIAPLGFWGPGSIVGASITEAFPYEIECLTDVKVEPTDLYTPLPMNSLLEHVRQSKQLMQILPCRRVDYRLGQFICWFAEKFGHSQTDGIHIKVRLTHQQLSESIGSTRVTVTRGLKQMERQGLISWSRRQQVVRPELLQALGYRDHAS